MFTSRKALTADMHRFQTDGKRWKIQTWSWTNWSWSDVPVTNGTQTAYFLSRAEAEVFWKRGKDEANIKWETR
jgi:hypothetical protein